MSGLVAQSQPAADPLQRLFAEDDEDSIRWRPEGATSLGRDEFNDQWSDWSKASRRARMDALRTYLGRAEAFSPGALSANDQLSLALRRYELRQALAGEEMDVYILSLYQGAGATIHNGVYSTIQAMPFRSVRDYDLLPAWTPFPRYVDQRIEALEEGLALGITQPAVVIDIDLSQMGAQLRQAGEQSLLLEAIRRFPPAVGAEDQARLRQRAIQAYNDRFVPAWRRLHAFLRDTYRPRARMNPGLSSIPNGADAYAFLVQRFTTTRTSARRSLSSDFRKCENRAGDGRGPETSWVRGYGG